MLGNCPQRGFVPFSETQASSHWQNLFSNKNKTCLEMQSSKRFISMMLSRWHFLYLYLQYHQHKNTPSLFFPCTLKKLVAETNPCRLVMPQLLIEIDQLQQSCFQTVLSMCLLAALHTYQQNSYFSFPTQPSTKASSNSTYI